jgi:hypothetical protein
LDLLLLKASGRNRPHLVSPEQLQGCGMFFWLMILPSATRNDTKKIEINVIKMKEIDGEDKKMLRNRIQKTARKK